MSNLDLVLNSDRWVKATPEKRASWVENIVAAEEAELMAGMEIDALTNDHNLPEDQDAYSRTNKERNVPKKVKGAFDGRLTTHGELYLDQVAALVSEAAAHPTGGTSKSFGERRTFMGSNKLRPVQAVKQNPNPFPGLSEMKEQKELSSGSSDMSYREYVEARNASLEDGASHLDPDNAVKKEQFDNLQKVQNFDPKSIKGVSEKVGGVLQFNPDAMGHPSKVIADIKGSDMSAGEKEIAIRKYRRELEPIATEVLKDELAIDNFKDQAKFLMAPVGNLAVDAIGGDRSLSAKWEKHLLDGGSSVDFLMENEDKFDRGFLMEKGLKLGQSFNNAMLNTGFGLLALGPGDYAAKSSAALAEREDALYEREGVEDIRMLGLDFTSRDFYSLAGQIGSFVAMGGIGSALGKGAATATAKGAGARLGKGILDGGVIAGLQGGGMEMGSAYNEAVQEGKTEGEAIKSAYANAAASGITTAVVTSLFGAFMPDHLGMEAFLGKSGTAPVSIAEAFASKFGTDAGKRVLARAVDQVVKADSPARKQIVAELTKNFVKTTNQAGLKAATQLVGNMGSEALEESVDQILGDVVKALAIEGKSFGEWWADAGNSAPEYFKAAVLGAIGGTSAGIGIGNPVERFKGARDGIVNQVQELGTDVHSDVTYDRPDADGNMETVTTSLGSFLELEHVPVELKVQKLVEAGRMASAKNAATTQVPQPTETRAPEAKEVPDVGPGVGTTERKAVNPSDGTKSPKVYPVPMTDTRGNQTEVQVPEFSPTAKLTLTDANGNDVEVPGLASDKPASFNQFVLTKLFGPLNGDNIYSEESSVRIGDKKGEVFKGSGADKVSSVFVDNRVAGVLIEKSDIGGNVEHAYYSLDQLRAISENSANATKGIVPNGLLRSSLMKSLVDLPSVDPSGLITTQTDEEADTGSAGNGDSEQESSTEPEAPGDSGEDTEEGSDSAATSDGTTEPSGRTDLSPSTEERVEPEVEQETEEVPDSEEVPEPEKTPEPEEIPETKEVPKTEEVPEDSPEVEAEQEAEPEAEAEVEPEQKIDQAEEFYLDPSDQNVAVDSDGNYVLTRPKESGALSLNKGSVLLLKGSPNSALTIESLTTGPNGEQVVTLKKQQIFSEHAGTGSVREGAAVIKANRTNIDQAAISDLKKILFRSPTDPALTTSELEGLLKKIFKSMSLGSSWDQQNIQVSTNVDSKFAFNTRLKDGVVSIEIGADMVNGHLREASKILGSAKGKPSDMQQDLIAIEASRWLARSLDEELLHKTTIEGMSSEELLGWLDDAESNAQFKDQFEHMAAMRGLDMTSEKDRLIIAGEAIATVAQLTTTGSTANTEFDAFIDVANAVRNDLSGVQTNKFSALIQAVKNYLRRFNNLLTARAMRGNLSQRQVAMLAQLKNLHNQRSFLTSDFDGMAAQATAEARKRQESAFNYLFGDNIEAEEMGIVPSTFMENHERAGILRQKLSDSTPLHLLLKINTDTSRIEMSPRITDFLSPEEKAGVEAYIEELNKQDVVTAMSRLMLENEVRLQTARDGLSFNPTEIFSNQGSAADRARASWFIARDISKREGTEAASIAEQYREILQNEIDHQEEALLNQASIAAERVATNYKSDMRIGGGEEMARALTLQREIDKEPSFHKEVRSGSTESGRIPEDQYVEWMRAHPARASELAAKRYPKKDGDPNVSESYTTYGSEAAPYTGAVQSLAKSKGTLALFESNVDAALAELGVKTHGTVGSERRARDLDEDSFMSELKEMRTSDVDDAVFNQMKLELDEYQAALDDYNEFVQYYPQRLFNITPTNKKGFGNSFTSLGKSKDQGMFGYDYYESSRALRNRANSKEYGTTTSSSSSPVLAERQRHARRQRIRRGNAINLARQNFLADKEAYYLKQADMGDPASYFKTAGLSLPMNNQESLLEGTAPPREMLPGFPLIGKIFSLNRLGSAPIEDQLRAVEQFIQGEDGLIEWMDKIAATVGGVHGAGTNRDGTWTTLVDELDGRQTIAGKFRDLLGRRIGRKFLDPNKPMPTDGLQSYVSFIEASIAAYRNSEVDEVMQNRLIRNITAAIPNMVESARALNAEVKLARSAFTEFTSPSLSRSFHEDLRGIQKFGDDPNEGMEAFVDLDYDIATMDNMQWHFDYFTSNETVRYLTPVYAAELHQSFGKLPAPTEADELLQTQDPVSRKRARDADGNVIKKPSSLPDVEGKIPRPDEAVLESTNPKPYQSQGQPGVYTRNETDEEGRPEAMGQSSETISTASDDPRQTRSYRKKLESDKRARRVWASQAAFSIFGGNSNLARKFFDSFRNNSFIDGKNMDDEVKASIIKVAEDHGVSFTPLLSAKYKNAEDFLSQMIEILAETERAKVAKVRMEAGDAATVWARKLNLAVFREQNANVNPEVLDEIQKMLSDESKKNNPKVFWADGGFDTDNVSNTTFDLFGGNTGGTIPSAILQAVPNLMVYVAGSDSGRQLKTGPQLVNIQGQKLLILPTRESRISSEVLSSIISDQIKENTALSSRITTLAHSLRTQLKERIDLSYKNTEDLLAFSKEQYKKLPKESQEKVSENVYNQLVRSWADETAFLLDAISSTDMRGTTISSNPILDSPVLRAEVVALSEEGVGIEQSSTPTDIALVVETLTSRNGVELLKYLNFGSDLALESPYSEKFTRSILQRAWTNQAGVDASLAIDSVMSSIDRVESIPEEVQGNLIDRFEAVIASGDTEILERFLSGPTAGAVIRQLASKEIATEARLPELSADEISNLNSEMDQRETGGEVWIANATIGLISDLAAPTTGTLKEAFSYDKETYGRVSDASLRDQDGSIRPLLDTRGSGGKTPMGSYLDFYGDSSPTTAGFRVSRRKFLKGSYMKSARTINALIRERLRDPSSMMEESVDLAVSLSYTERPGLAFWEDSLGELGKVVGHTELAESVDFVRAEYRGMNRSIRETAESIQTLEDLKEAESKRRTSDITDELSLAKGELIDGDVDDLLDNITDSIANVVQSGNLNNATIGGMMTNFYQKFLREKLGDSVLRVHALASHSKRHTAEYDQALQMLENSQYDLLPENDPSDSEIQMAIDAEQAVEDIATGHQLIVDELNQAVSDLSSEIEKELYNYAVQKVGPVKAQQIVEAGIKLPQYGGMVRKGNRVELQTASQYFNSIKRELSGERIVNQIRRKQGDRNLDILGEKFGSLLDKSGEVRKILKDASELDPSTSFDDIRSWVKARMEGAEFDDNFEMAVANQDRAVLADLITLSDKDKRNIAESKRSQLVTGMNVRLESLKNELAKLEKEKDEWLGRNSDKKRSFTYYKTLSPDAIADRKASGIMTDYLPVNVEVVITPPPIKKADETANEKKEREYLEDAYLSDVISYRAMDRALSTLVSARGDAVYAQVKADMGYTSDFDYEKAISSTVKKLELERGLKKDRAKEFEKLLDKQGFLKVDSVTGISPGMMAVAVNEDTVLATPVANKGGKEEMSKKMERFKATKDITKRAQQISLLLKNPDTGESMMFFPVDARTDLAEMKLNKGESLAGLDAEFQNLLFHSSTGKAAKPGTPSHIFGAESLKSDIKDYDARKAEGEAKAKMILGSGGLLEKVQMVDVKDKSEGPLGKFGRRTQSLYTRLIRDIYTLGNHKNVRNPKTDSQRQAAKMLSEFEMKMKKLPHEPDMEKAIQELNILETFSAIFAETLGDSMLKRIASGIVEVTPKMAGVYRHLHHQSARVRRELGGNFAAYQQAVGLLGLMEYGFDGETGPSGSQSEYMDMKKRLADSASKLGTNWDVSSRAYIIASLEGIAEAARVNGVDGYPVPVAQQLSKWVGAFENGIGDLNSLSSLRAMKGGKIKSWLTGGNSSLISASDASKKLYAEFSSNFTVSALSDSTEALKAIDKAIEDLKKGAPKKRKEMEAYASELGSAFSEVQATQKASQVLGHFSAEDRVYHEDSGRKRRGLVNTSPSNIQSVVPIRFASSSNPYYTKQLGDGDAEYSPDTEDNLALEESALLGRGGYSQAKSGHARSRSSEVLRPIDLNGLGAPDAIMRDGIYRIEVSPNYHIFRSVFGKETGGGNKTFTVTGDAYMSPSISSLPPTQKKAWRLASTLLAREVERDINNDLAIGVEDSRVGRTFKFLGTAFIFRKLFSLQQPLIQTVPAMIGFATKKVVVGEAGAVRSMLEVVGRTAMQYTIGKLTPKWLRKSLGFGTMAPDPIAEFIKRNNIYVYKRGMDGQDVSQENMRDQSTHGNILKRALKRTGANYQKWMEKGMDIIFGAPERVVARAFYMSELLVELQRVSPDTAPSSIDELLKMDASDIDILAKQRAAIKTDDMMGVSDQSKKGTLFQNSSKSPTFGEMRKAMVRFSNHTATTHSNASALSGSFARDDMAMKREALENITGTLTQNILFFMLKANMAIPLALYAIARAQGDEEEEAAAKASEKATKILSTKGMDPDGQAGLKFLKELTFGSGWHQLQPMQGQSYANSKDEAMANLITSIGWEAAAVIPGVGVAAGYSQTGQVTDRWRHKLSDEIVELFNDETDEPVDSYFESIPKDFGWLEDTASALNSTDVAFDAAEAIWQVAGPEGDKSDEAGFVAKSAYLMKDLLGTRELRSASKKQIEKETGRDRYKD